MRATRLSRARRATGAIRTALAVLLVGAGCASTQNTPAQDLAWERWQRCKGAAPRIELKEIRPTGSISYLYADPASKRAFEQCWAQALQEEARHRPAPAVVPPPTVTAIAAPVGSAPGEIPVPVWKKGDMWTFRYEEPSGAGTFLWSVERVEMVAGLPNYVIKSGRREIFYSIADLALTQETVDGKVVLRVRPPVWRGVDFPLSIGKSWDMTYEEQKPLEHQTATFERRCTAETEATVRVPAGIFPAIVVLCRNARTGAVVVRTWYSPAVKQWVRHEVQLPNGVRRRELTAYALVSDRER